MEQRYNYYAVPEDAQITPRTEAFAGGMEQRINFAVKKVAQITFMPQLTSHACSCAFVRYCNSTDKRAIGSFAEESENAYLSSRASGVMDGR